MPKNRIFYLDFIRSIACLAVFICHFNAAICQYQADGTFLFPENAVFPIFVLGGVYLGGYGVSLFFMLSGASLQLSWGSKEKISLKAYYVKRIKGIYPMYWLCWFLFTTLAFLLNHGLPSSPLWDVAVSLLGMDGYFLTLGMPCGGFYTVGEWYLGCLLLIYLIWPFLYKASAKHPWICMAVWIAVYICLSGRMSNIFFLLHIPEILFGMYFIRYIREPKAKHAIAAGGVLVLLLLVGSSILGLGYEILVAACSFVILAYLGSVLRGERIKELLSKFAALSWPFFLVHHQIIGLLCTDYGYSGLRRRNAYMLLIVTFLITLIAAGCVKTIYSKIINELEQKG